ncbi:(d)CMP kinase [Spiroplasma endosymbiont of Amphibalanus improvisus]|uniref:(d)CMP kinase n=1 Tax=Spiroplasma endosymbiont of Amphibalanus improvisus TaxID=3066327 RepID=UPI00313CE292
MKQINIAIDGTSGSGKSSTAEKLVEKLGYIFVDTGLMYRAITWIFLKNNVDNKDTEKMKKYLSDFSFLNNGEYIQAGEYKIPVKDLTNEKVTKNTPKYAKISLVREYMVKIQKSVATKKGIIMVGRDITSVVLPAAELKVFITTSDPLVRAKRRLAQNIGKKDVSHDLQNVLDEINNRDKDDTLRKDGCLTNRNCNLIIDNSDKNLDEVVDIIIKEVNNLTKK